MIIGEIRIGSRKPKVSAEVDVEVEVEIEEIEEEEGEMMSQHYIQKMRPLAFILIVLSTSHNLYIDYWIILFLANS